MQEKMQQLQQQLEASQKASASSPPPVARTAEKPAELKPKAPKVTQAKPTAAAQKAKAQAGRPFIVDQSQQTGNHSDGLVLCFHWKNLMAHHQLKIL